MSNDETRKVKSFIYDADDQLRAKWNELLLQAKLKIDSHTINSAYITVVKRFIAEFRHLEKVIKENLKYLEGKYRSDVEIDEDDIETMETLFGLRTKFLEFSLTTKLIDIDTDNLKCIIRDKKELKEEIEMSYELMKNLISEYDSNPIMRILTK